MKVSSRIARLLSGLVYLLWLTPGTVVAQVMQLTDANGQQHIVHIGNHIVVERSSAYGERFLKARLVNLTANSLLLEAKNGQTRTVPLKEVVALRRRNVNLAFMVAASTLQIGVLALNPFPDMAGLTRAAAVTGVYAGAVGLSYGAQSILQGRKQWFRLDDGYRFEIIQPDGRASASRVLPKASK